MIVTDEAPNKVNDHGADYDHHTEEAAPRGGYAVGEEARPEHAGAGTAVLALGAFLFLQADGTLDLARGHPLPSLGGCVLVVLIAKPWAGAGAGRGRRDEDLRLPRPWAEETSRVSKVGFAVGVLLGAALLFLWANGVLEVAGRVALAALVVTIALMLISAPFWRGDGQASRRRARRASSFGGAGGGGRAPPRLGPPDARADPEARRMSPSRSRGSLAGRRASCASGSPTPSRAGRTSGSPTRCAPPRPRSRIRTATPIEAVVVGDAPLDERLEALVAQPRGAHQRRQVRLGRRPGRLYAEIEKGDARVFIDDRGPGFDPTSIPTTGAASASR